MEVKMKAELIFTILMLCSLMFSEQITQVKKLKAEKTNLNYKIERNFRNVPHWEFHTQPVHLIESYYDYMPGGYNESPIKLMSDETGDYVYMAYHAQESQSSQRRIFYSKIYPGGDFFTGHLSISELREGFPSIDIEPISGEPFHVYHSALSGNQNLDIAAHSNICNLHNPK